MQLAVKHRVRSICFPAISCGVFGYPFVEGAQVRGHLGRSPGHLGRSPCHLGRSPQHRAAARTGSW